jgi:hypothetical protein
VPCAIAHVVPGARIPVVACLPGRVCASRAVAQTSVVVAARGSNTGTAARTTNAAGAGFAHFLHAVSTCASRPGPGTALAIGYLAGSPRTFVTGSAITVLSARRLTNAIAARKSGTARRHRSLAVTISVAKAAGRDSISRTGSGTPVIGRVLGGNVGTGPRIRRQVAGLADWAVRGCPCQTSVVTANAINTRQPSRALSGRIRA